MENDQLLNQTGNQFNQEPQVNNSNLEDQIDWIKEKENLNKLVNEENLSYKEIGRRYNRSEATIRKQIKKLKISAPIRNLANREKTPWNKGIKRIKSEETIKKEALKIKQYNQTTNAKEHNKRIKKYQFPLKEIQPGQCPICGDFDCKDSFCKNHNFLQLIGFVKHLGFDSSKIGTKDVKTEFNRVRELVYDLYWNKQLSLVDLGKKFNYGRIIPAETMDNLGIPRRNNSDAVNIAILQGKIVYTDFVKSFFGKDPIYHSSWNGKTFMLRSSYEEDYANDLDKLNIEYEVENLLIEYFDSVLNRKRIAIPDFYLPNTNEIIEIKSDFTLDIQEMLDKFDAYKNLGYIPKLILEHNEIDLYNIDNLINRDRLDKIKNSNLKQLKLKGLIKF